MSCKIEGVPDGYELVRIGAPKVGEFFINGNHVNKASECFDYLDNLAIVRKIEPPKPIEPPEGYRLLTENDKIAITDKWWHWHKCWEEFSDTSHCIGIHWNPIEHRPMCRKIEPKVRPMTRAEFLAAWKQRNFCPLIDSHGMVQLIEHVETDEERFVFLSYSGFLSDCELARCKFASDETYLTIEE